MEPRSQLPWSHCGSYRLDRKKKTAAEDRCAHRLSAQAGIVADLGKVCALRFSSVAPVLLGSLRATRPLPLEEFKRLRDELLVNLEDVAIPHRRYSSVRTCINVRDHTLSSPGRLRKAPPMALEPSRSAIRTERRTYGHALPLPDYC